jgi:hypothetical protein
MTAMADLRALLVADSGVTSLVAQRVRFERAEETDELPYVVLLLADTENTYSLAGDLVAAKSVLQAQCWATSQVQAAAIAAAVSAVCLADRREVAGPAGEYVPDLGLEGAILTIDWWAD